MIIVGVGIGPLQLTEEAIQTIKKAKLIYGSKRAIELAQHHITCKTHIIKDYSRIQELPEEAVILSTGDPMLSGLGKYKKPADTIIPGISSMQVACARLGIPEENTEIITIHGRDHTTAENQIISTLQRKKTLFLLPDPKTFGPGELAKLLNTHNINATITICEKLTYPNEEITTTNTQQTPLAPKTSLYCIMVKP